MHSRMIFCLFILCFLIELEWFSNIKQLKQTNHQKAFRQIVACLIVAALAKIAKYLSVEFLDEKTALFILNIAFCFYYIAITYVCMYFAEICYTLVHIDSDLERKQKILLSIPAVFVSVFLLADPIFHHIIRIDGLDNITARPLFYVQIFIVILYTLPAFFYVFRHSKYLPKTFLISLLVLIFLWTLVVMLMIVSGNDDSVLSAFTIGVALVMFALLSYGKFLNPDVKLFNKKALYIYLDRCVEKRIETTIYIVRALGHEYLDDFDGGKRANELLTELKNRLQKISPVKNLYYVGNGRIVIVTDRRDKVDDKSFCNDLKENCEKELVVDDIPYMLNVDILILKMPQDIKSVDQLKQFLIYNENTTQIRDMEENVHIYQDEDLHVQKAIRVRMVEDAIRRAIDEHAFQVYFQPIYSLKQNQFHSAEALIRLNDSKMGFIPPDEFIPIAEKNGTIVEIGLQVFETVCQFIHNEGLKSLGIDYIEVNLSMEQFMDDLLYYKLQSIMDKYEIEKSALNLEITETATMYEEVKLRRQMKFMSEKGFNFSLDDYGSGFSNLESVIEYPLELVKLDKTIVWSAEHNEKSYSTMQTLIQLFHNLGMRIVAEGVETDEQLDILKKMDCDYIQGYYYSKPLCKEDFLEYMKQYNCVTSV